MDTLFWVDQYRGLIRSAVFADRGFELAQPLDMGGAVGAIVPDVRGGWMVTAREGFFTLSGERTLEPLASVLPADGVRRRMNDGKVDPSGRFWAGTMAFDKRQGAGSLYLLDHGNIRTALTDVTISNGLAWTADGTTMYYIDTPTHRIDRFRVDGHSLIREAAVVDIPTDHGNPDGMCIDDEGMLWVALWGGSAVHRYTPEGQLIGRVEVDAPQVSSCAFGGPDRDILFITTSREDYTAADEQRHPLAGAIFAVRPGVTGPPAAAYQP